MLPHYWICRFRFQIFTLLIWLTAKYKVLTSQNTLLFFYFDNLVKKQLKDQNSLQIMTGISYQTSKHDHTCKLQEMKDSPSLFPRYLWNFLPKGNMTTFSIRRPYLSWLSSSPPTLTHMFHNFVKVISINIILPRLLCRLVTAKKIKY